MFGLVWDRSRWEDSYARYYHLQAARERDRDGRASLVAFLEYSFLRSPQLYTGQLSYLP